MTRRWPTACTRAGGRTNRDVASRSRHANLLRPMAASDRVRRRRSVEICSRFRFRQVSRLRASGAGPFNSCDKSPYDLEDLEGSHGSAAVAQAPLIGIDALAIKGSDTRETACLIERTANPNRRPAALNSTYWPASLRELGALLFKPVVHAIARVIPRLRRSACRGTPVEECRSCQSRPT